MRIMLALAFALSGLAAAAAEVAIVPGSIPDPDDLVPVEDMPEAARWPGGLEAFDDRPYAVRQGVGRVVDVDPDGPRVIIDGLVFAFAIDAEVRLLSGFGAPTLLRPGMAVEYYYRDGPRSRVAGEIVALVEFPAEALEAE